MDKPMKVPKLESWYKSYEPKEEIHKKWSRGGTNTEK